MIWLTVLLPAILVLGWLFSRRGERVPILPGQTLSTLHSTRSKKTSKQTKDALDAATLLLR